MFRVIKKGLKRLKHEVQMRLGPEPAWRAKKRVVDDWFDRSYGVDTGGITHLKSMRIKNNSWREGFDHIAVDPEEFSTAINSLKTDLSRFTFIDIGSGKGRALLLASEYPFKRIIGVEFAEPLVRAAQANLIKLGHHGGSNRIQVVHADALDYDLPSVPSILFFYNPFGSRIMDAFANRTRMSLLESPRELLVLYLNPFHVDEWLKAGFKRIYDGQHFAVLKFPTASFDNGPP